MYLVTLGQRLASALASPLVIRRQLFPPNPSETESVICLGPHHAGVPAVALPPGDADAPAAADWAWVGAVDGPPPPEDAGGLEQAEIAIRRAARAPSLRTRAGDRVAMRSIASIAPPPNV